MKVRLKPANERPRRSDGLYVQIVSVIHDDTRMADTTRTMVPVRNFSAKIILDVSNFRVERMIFTVSVNHPSELVRDACDP